ncbi:MAG: helix-hairpin-helix domain-containing protein [Emergencia sp.]
MERLKPYLTWLKEHDKMMKAAAAVLILTVAVVFFGGYGENTENSIVLEEPADAAEEAESSEEAAGAAEETGDIYIDIDGEVKNPGVYMVSAGTRIYQVIEKAGGLTEDADTTSLNQADKVTDGQKIIVPAKSAGQGQSASSDLSGSSGTSAAGVSADGRININLADSTLLQEIPGVGPVTAQKIIDYRNSSGPFASIEDICNVSGIGEKTFQKMKDQITV